MAVKNTERAEKVQSFGMGRRNVAGMLKLVCSVISVLARGFRSQVVLEKENFALPHQLHVLRCQ